MPVRVALYGTSSRFPVFDSFKEYTQIELDARNSVPVHRLLVAHPLDDELKNKTPLFYARVQDVSQENDKGVTLSEPAVSLQQHNDSRRAELVMRYPQLLLWNDYESKTKLAPLMANELHAIFAEERAMIGRIEESRKNQEQTPLEVLVKDQADEIGRRQHRSMKYASTYHLTFSLFTPEAVPSDWDIETSLSQTIRPLLKALSPICNFTIDTQVQPYAQFSSSVQPVYREGRRTWELKSSDLGGFINSAEWPLSPSIGAGPTINFLLYVPSVSQAPLAIEGTDSTGWLILQWGGIAIHNPSNIQLLEETGRLTADELREPFLTFSQHLLDLLGLPSPNLPFQLRLQSQTRILALRLIASASSTLGSLARLTQSLTSISIPDTVASSVDLTIIHLEFACAALNRGDFQAALDAAKIADEEAEKAFFHKSMVGQVYFPDEHKVAVYLPLLGPVAVPLAMTAIKEVKAWSKARKFRGG